jgi:hypothetical protein
MRYCASLLTNRLWRFSGNIPLRVKSVLLAACLASRLL